MSIQRLSLRVLLSVIACCVMSVLSAQTVSKKFEEQPLKLVLKEIELQTGMSIIYNSESFNDRKIISVEFKNTPISEVLNKILDSKYRYSIVKRIIVIYEKQADPVVPQRDSTSRISGIVTIEDEQPLSGASVIIKGTTKGTTTRSDGKFSISGISPEDVLEITYLGFQKQSVVVGNNRNIVVRMLQSLEAMDDVVVVGYGVQKRTNITGSVTSVKPSELTSAPAFSVAQALQGRVAGMLVQNTSGDPAGSSEIRIRGANSLEFGNRPLVIIDGIQGGDINTLNPNQIKSIEVLKDAAALSIYGSNGANGVILVTTKLGEKDDKGHIGYNAFASVDQIAKYMPTLEAWEYAQLFEQARAEQGRPPVFDPRGMAKLGKGTNWQSQLYRTAISHNHNLSIGGSKKDISYYIALGTLQKQGIILNNEYEQYTLRGNLQAKATENLEITVNVYAIYNKNHHGQTDVLGALQWAPTVAVYDTTSKFGYSQAQSNGIGPVAGGNPVASALEYVNESFSSAFNASLKADYKITNYLKFSSQLIYKPGGGTNAFFDNGKPVNAIAKDVNGGKTVQYGQDLQNTNILTFDEIWGKHDIQATGVYELKVGTSHSMYGGASGIPIKMGYYGIAFGTKFDIPGPGYSKLATNSLIGRINYAYDNKYLFSASLRRDGASQLAEGHKYDNFWSVSGGWNIIKEAFMSSVKPAISSLKLRASYGIMGNAAVPAYSSLLKFVSGLDANNQTVITLNQAENKTLGWEKTGEFNVGIDASLMKGRLDVTLEHYNKKTTGLLMWQEVPIVSIVKSVLRNIGSVSNRGWDFSITGIPLTTKNFRWITNLTLNKNQNKILKLDGINDYIYTTPYVGMYNAQALIVGQPIGTFRGLTFIGTWKSNEASTAALYGAKPGDAKYVDQNKDGKIDDEDVTIIGNSQPEAVYGFNNTLRYKNFDFNIFFQGVYGNQVLNINRLSRETYGGVFPTSPTIREHWTPDHETDNPSFTGIQYNYSSRWIEDGSYIRLKNLALGYNLPEKWLSKIKASNLRIYASAMNLWTMTKYSGYDPESANGMDKNGGIDYSVYPSARSFVLGIDLAF